MNQLHPLIEDLANCLDDASRARWLLACPLSVLMTYSHTVVNRLRNAHFVDGVAYVEAELALCRQVRKSGLPNRDNALRAGMLDVAGFRAIEAGEV